jgi:hypothetical protein
MTDGALGGTFRFQTQAQHQDPTCLMGLAVRRRIISGHDPVALTLRPLRNLQHP